ncbi:MAG UNVERIFIED_CONTAM: hypothetical protein LVQ98_02825 [Rickettsiaceae bacterium]
MAEQYLYYDHKIWDFSNEIEYGYNETISYGVSSNNARSKFHSSKNIGIFYKHNLYKTRNLILTIKPNINFNNNANLLRL